MSDLLTSDVEYRHQDTRMIGHALAPTAGPPDAAAVLLLHDAYGISDHLRSIAADLAAHGHPVFAADLWGERTLPTSEAEIGPLIGGMVGDRERWLGRVAAAHRALTEQPWAEGRPVAALGYCFGGSSALEHLRTGARLDAVASIHGGLDLLADDWSAAHPSRVLICTGAQDPMATAAQRSALESAMDTAGMDWQTHLYSGTRHAFTSAQAKDSPMPQVVAYHPTNAARAWRTTLTFLRELGTGDPIP